MPYLAQAVISELLVAVNKRQRSKCQVWPRQPNKSCWSLWRGGKCPSFLQYMPEGSSCRLFGISAHFLGPFVQAAHVQPTITYNLYKRSPMIQKNTSHSAVNIPFTGTFTMAQSLLFVQVRTCALYPETYLHMSQIQCCKELRRIGVNQKIQEK